MIVTGLLIMIPVYVLLTVARRHNVTYLNGIFEMKNSKMPIFITQPYIYVANNFENFNCMVEQLTAHTWGTADAVSVFCTDGIEICISTAGDNSGFCHKNRAYDVNDVL